MAYYTNFMLTVEAADENGKAIGQITDENLLDELDQELDKMNVFQGRQDDSTWFALDQRWYYSEEDMLLLSKRFPSMVFHLHGEGENAEDLWNTHYWNGKSQQCPAVINYDPYDPAELEPAAKILEHYHYEQLDDSDEE